MSSESDERVKRAVESYATKVEAAIKRDRLDALASEERERKQTAFLNTFVQKAKPVIESVLERHAAEINALSTGKWLDNAEARRRAVSSRVDQPNDEYRVVLVISRDTRRATLVFLADPQKMTVVVLEEPGSVGGARMPGLDLEQVTDDNVGQFVAGFLEKYLHTL
jgi:hypothetical protein